MLTFDVTYNLQLAFGAVFDYLERLFSLMTNYKFMGFDLVDFFLGVFLIYILFVLLLGSFNKNKGDQRGVFMKKVYLFIFGLFSLILCFSNVKASEYPLSSFGKITCFDSQDNISYNCAFNSINGDVVYKSGVSTTNYILVPSSDFYFINTNSYYAIICYYDSSYSLISCSNNYIDSSADNPITPPINAYFFRVSYRSNVATLVVDESNISSLSVLSNSITHLIDYVIDLITSATIILYIVLGITITLVLVGVVKWLRS